MEMRTGGFAPPVQGFGFFCCGVPRAARPGLLSVVPPGQKAQFAVLYFQGRSFGRRGDLPMNGSVEGRGFLP